MKLIPPSILFALVLVHTATHAADVIVEDLTLHDGKRGKAIECRVYFPAVGDKLPLIAFSHGFGADRAAFTVIAHHWAEHGYVVIAPSHWDGFGKSKGTGDVLPAGGLQALMENAAAKIENRVGDVAFILDSTEQLSALLPVLRGRIDVTRTGVGGHSLGAYTTMLIGGVTADIGEQKARSFKDDRVRCILPISGQGTGQQGLTPSSWVNLKLPMMTMTGSLDKGAGGQGPEWKQESFKFCPAGDKYLVFIEGANHVSFGGSGSRDAGITDAVKRSTLAFWDAYLKDDDSAKASLTSGSVFATLKGKATLQAK